MVSLILIIILNLSMKTKQQKVNLSKFFIR